MEIANAFTYAPKPETDEIIKQLDDIYKNHRFRVMELIFSKQTSAIKSLADAFKIKKDNDDG